MLIERWRIEHNTFRPHSSLGYRPPAPEAFFKTFIVQNTPEMISSPRASFKTSKTFLQHEHSDPKFQKGQEHTDMILPSDNEPPIVAQPSESALNDISSLVAIPESVVLPIHVPMILSVGRKKVDPSFSHPLTGRVAVVGLVADHALWSGPRSARTLLGNTDVPHDFLKERDLSRRGRRGMASQRNTLAIDHHQVLCSLAPLGLSDCCAPFFAGMKVASTKASSQSRIPS